LSGGTLGPPDFEKALLQHAAYCRALANCGLKVLSLPADPAYPDSTFVEDVAIVTRQCALLTRPGAASRSGETAGIRQSLQEFFPDLQEIHEPGTLDGGDVCDAGNHFFIGISHRTNETGAQELAELLGRAGYTSSLIDIRGMKGILHLKSGLAYLGEKDLVLWDELAEQATFAGYHHVRVTEKESYAANCVRVNDYVLVPAGFPATADAIRKRGCNLLPLDVSEFRKMDGGLSCLSLRF